MKTTTKEKLKYLRFIPLLACVVVAIGICAPLCIHAVEAVVAALGGVTLAGLWIGGPFLMAICLGFLLREKAGKVVFDLSLLLLVVVDFGGLVLAALPFVGVRDVFTWLPFLQFLGLTGLLVAVMLGRILFPELAKLFRSGTFKEI
jgi:hypothetical protein